MFLQGVRSTEIREDAPSLFLLQLVIRIGYVRDISGNRGVVKEAP